MDLTVILCGIFDRRKLSYKTIATMFGFRSATSVARLLRGDTSLRLIHDFAAHVLTCGELDLTEDEVAQLSTALKDRGEMITFGRLWNVVTNETEMTDSVGTVITDIENGSSVSLEEMISDAAYVRLQIFNCMHPELFACLEKVSHHVPIEVAFYYIVGDSAMQSIRMLESAFDVLHRAWFHAYTVPSGAASGLVAGNLMRLYLNRKDGSTEEYLIVEQGENTAWKMPFHPNAFVNAEKLLLNGAVPEPLQITAGSHIDYLNYLKYCEKLEHNSQEFSIRPEFSLEQIPVDILLEAVKEGRMGQIDNFDKIARPLLKVQRRRFDNTRKKRRYQHMVYSLEAMRRFAETGILSDHFWGMRAFNREERKAILQDLLEHIRSSSYCHMYFLLPGVNLHMNGMTWYENHGVTILAPHTTYDLNHGHSELVLKDESFERFFTGYFRKHVIEEKVYSEEESQKMLEELVASI